MGFPSRKRELEDRASSPESEQMGLGTVTPDEILVAKRSRPIVEPEDNHNLTAVPSWNDWEQRGNLSSILMPKTKDPLNKLAGMPHAAEQTMSAFPLQFGFNTGPVHNNGSASAGPSSNTADRNIVIDPALSSVRSSADQPAGSGALSPHIPPELRFPEETLHSATASPGTAVLEAALRQTEEAEAAQRGELDMLAPPDDDSPRKDQPFSRSPELRISHKLAERKRRREMKDLFDELRDLLPAERGSKSSKWEILSKAIDYIGHMKAASENMVRDVEKLRRDLDTARGGTGGSYPNSNYTYGMPHFGGANYPPAATGVAGSGNTPGNVAVGVGQPTNGNQGQGQNQGQAPAATQQEEHDPPASG